MKAKKIPLRMCLGCQEMKPKKELIRVVKDSQGEVKVDLTGKAQGRGAYICRNIDCLDKSIKTKRFEKNFQMRISEDIYNKLREELLDE